LAGPWRLGAAIAPAGPDQQYATVDGEAFLADGRVLVLWTDVLDWEGELSPSRSSLYDPQTDSWTELAPPWDYQGHLPGVLSVVGLADGSALAVLSLTPGMGATGTGTQSALFDPQESVWLPPVDVPIDDSISARDGVMLGDGRMLMFGVGVASTYLFDPATGSWGTGPTLPFDDLARAGWILGPSVAVLDDGSVIALATDGRSAELPAGGTAWARSGRADVGGHAEITAIRGGAVALGGDRYCGDFSCHDSRSAVYRADIQRWSPGPDSPDAFGGSARMLLPDGRLLVAGGEGGGTDYDCVSLASILSADAASWQSIQPMPACMAYGAGRLQADGTVLIVGSGDVYDGDVDLGVGIVPLTYRP
jgi:hypothetical protein